MFWGRLSLPLRCSQSLVFAVASGVSSGLCSGSPDVWIGDSREVRMSGLGILRNSGCLDWGFSGPPPSDCDPPSDCEAIRGKLPPPYTILQLIILCLTTTHPLPALPMRWPPVRVQIAHTSVQDSNSLLIPIIPAEDDRSEGPQ